MTNRPTPEQILSDEIDAYLIGTGFRAGDVLDTLRSHGYVIVHPDDVPTKLLRSPTGVGTDPFALGWNKCRDSIFGDNP